MTHRLLAALLAAGALAAGAADAAEQLVPLARPGPWSGISSLIGYGERLWFVNSVKFVDHNSADVYSYDPRAGTTRYEAHLFSQDAGDPVVAGGLLYWPFEDARFSAGRGEYLVTDGRRWRWRILPEGEVFHVHAMAAAQGALFAATSAWRAGLQRSEDAGTTWRIVYEHPDAAGGITRIMALAVHDGILYAGLNAPHRGARLLRLDGDTLRPVAGWPAAFAVDALASYRGRLYGATVDAVGSRLWRTDSRTVEPAGTLDGTRIRAIAPGPDALWAITAANGGGALWRSGDGASWTVVQRFDDAEPLAVIVYAGGVYVGTRGRKGRGTLWGPAAPAAAETSISGRALSAPSRLDDTTVAFRALDRALVDPATYVARSTRLRDAVQRLALGGGTDTGRELSRRLSIAVPEISVSLFGGALTPPAAALARWYVLWGIGLNGHGHVPVELLRTAWTERPNRAEKYLNPTPAAAWAAARLGQADDATLDALVARLGAAGQPDWIDGDLVGALSALTGERFGYDLAAWRRWWAARRGALDAAAAPPAMIAVPAGTVRMGAGDGEPAERPVHVVAVPAFAIDRCETTNAEFAEFVASTGHRTDAERSGLGWHWNGVWREVRGADWRHPHGPRSTIDGLAYHPVVQASWRDAQAYCGWRGKRLPTEAEWERSARGSGDRTYPWGDAPPRDGARYRASYGSDRCCRSDDGDGYLFTAPVGSFPLGRSPFGVEDLAGNVWEWVEDTFDETFYARSPAARPVNRSAGPRKVIRGGGWGNDAAGLRSTLRHANSPEIGLSMVGIRCAR